MKPVRQTYTVTIDDIGMNAEGIAHHEGKTFFVPFSLPGEKCKVIPIHEKKNLVFAKLVEVLTPEEDRVRPCCPVFGKCGGCQLQHLKYSEQLRVKHDLVETCFAKIADLEVTVQHTGKSTEEYGYRNKLQMPVTRAKDGSPLLGFYAPNTHRVVPTSDCPLHGEFARRLIAILSEFMQEYGISSYEESSHTGLVRHLIARKLTSLMVVIVINGTHLPHAGELYRRLHEAFGAVGLYLNINKAQTNVITGKEYHHVGGLTVQSETVNGIIYEVHPESFLQVNNRIRDRIYTRVANLLDDERGVVIDAYSGAGLLTAILAQRFDEVYGIEIVPEAVENANHLKNTNRIENMHPILGDCAVELPVLVHRLTQRGKRVSVVLDPPRKGCDAPVLQAISECLPHRIVYISCNPATLARDVGILTKTLTPTGAPIPKEERELSPYEVTYVKPYDMFAQTKHVETVVLLTKK